MVGGVFLLLALFFFVPIWHKQWYWWLLLPGLPLATLGAVYPRGLKWVYVGWMSLAMILGALVSTVLLIFLFYLTVTPIGLIARLAGKDFLNQKLRPTASSFWILRNVSTRKQKHEHEQQF